MRVSQSLLLLLLTHVVSSEKRVIGGVRMQRGQVPSLVSLTYQFQDGTVSACGGSLISPRVVLTAAHCYYDDRKKPMKVGGGNRWVARIGTEFIGSEMQSEGEGASEAEDSAQAQQQALEETLVFRQLEKGIKQELEQEQQQQQPQDSFAYYQENTDDNSYASYEKRWLFLRKRKRASPYASDYEDDGNVYNGEFEFGFPYDGVEENESSNNQGQQPKVEELFEVEITQVFPHQKYGFDSLENDVALMVLKEAPPFSKLKHIEVAKLPTESMQGDFPKAFENCMFAGWGCEHSGAGISSYANIVNLTLRRDDVCEAIYETSIDSKRQICAGTLEAEHKGTCPGDSGGPLLCPYKGEFYQAGVLSYGVGGKEAYYPPVFARVSYYLDWIATTMKSMRL